MTGRWQPCNPAARPMQMPWTCATPGPIDSYDALLKELWLGGFQSWVLLSTFVMVSAGEQYFAHLLFTRIRIHKNEPCVALPEGERTNAYKPTVHARKYKPYTPTVGLLDPDRFNCTDHIAYIV